MKCRFQDNRTYRVCDKRAKKPSWFCAEHSKLKCVVCGEQATGYCFMHTKKRKGWILSCCQDECVERSKRKFREGKNIIYG